MGVRTHTSNRESLSIDGQGKPVYTPEIAVSVESIADGKDVPVSTRIPLRTLPIVYEDKDQRGTPGSLNIDARKLEADLKQVVKGEVRFDGGTRAMYAHDASNYRMVPVGVVIPKDKKDVINAVAVARKHGCPLHGRGGGTGIPGQTLNVGLVLDFSKYMNSILEIDSKKRVARVQPGVVLDELREETRKQNLTFGPDPATHSRCTLGGMIGNNSCGTHSVRWGRTADNIEELEVLLYDGTILKVGWTDDQELEKRISKGGREGEIFWKLKKLRDAYADEIRAKYPHIPRRVSGYNLDELLPERPMNIARALVGSEGTCAITLEATLKLEDALQERVLVLLGFDSVETAGHWVMEGLKYKPIALEGMDDSFFEDMARKQMHPEHVDQLPPGRAWLFIEFGSDTKEDADKQAEDFLADLKKKEGSPIAKKVEDKELEEALWHLRDEGLGATSKVPGDPENHDGWEDTAVHPKDVGNYLKDFRALLDRYNYKGALYGHFGDGCIHTRLNFDFTTKAGIEKFKRFLHEGTDIVLSYGGSLSGEHGDGQARGELLSRMFGEKLIQAFAEFKQIWDPDWKMNPGKIIAPYGVDENLFEGTKFNLPAPKTHFQFPNDKYSFGEATLRCVGAGVCRRKEGGTMCPSYMVTHEEKHSTRGRARILYEMLQGETVKDEWKSQEVFDALDLCLSCKGCKGDCPVQVDMATYKAEFLSHYYKGRVRPRHAYAFGLIHTWARLASWMPELVNLAMRLPGIGHLAKKVAGMDQSRSAPKFASYTFKEWFKARRNRLVSDKRVILWPDTFNNHFHPTTAQAAVAVLEDAGFEVEVPMQEMCCGRPLYDYGMLDMAKKRLQHILNILKNEIEAGTPIVVLEPSCASVFKEELGNLFPHDVDAYRLRTQVFLLPDFLAAYAPNYKPRVGEKKNAVVHGHCHQKSIWKQNSEEKLLKEAGYEFDKLDSGCCGMAGAFGFEEGLHHELSLKVGERVLLPTVREADEDTLIVADGFSCREQIKQETGRRALHVAEVLNLPNEAKSKIPKEALVKKVIVYGAMASILAGIYLTQNIKKRCNQEVK
ncbi:MAG TPA: FAD-binding and (Fe-S)-binding domain-containing protein [Fimbriimonadaceae bacterium]|jgi:FAD/FMN-containing dehydrogenase/Fe-S oxidoreductase